MIAGPFLIDSFGDPQQIQWGNHPGVTFMLAKIPFNLLYQIDASRQALRIAEAEILPSQS